MSEYIQVKIKAENKAKLSALVMIIAFSGLIYINLNIALPLLLDCYERIYNLSYYVEVSRYSLPSLAALPFSIYIIYLAIKFILSKVTDIEKKVFYYVSIGSIIVFFVSRILFGFWVDHRLEQLNYYWCFQYEIGGMLRPNIYVKDPELCYPKSKEVGKKVMLWLDQQEANSIQVTGQMLRDQANIYFEQEK
ncbi:DUF1240 domain-containing protein [Aliikangiella maris]|uniref:DUF1240 domain-containing protein n=2 Tax=Aliikangiella maris TaxID=3162458 RepID=A0ABV2BZK5_9GAMM